MKAVVTVVGKDTVGILAKVSTLCAQCNVNVEDVTQSIMQNLFTMIMMVDISGLNVTFTEFSAKLNEAGKELGLEIHTMHEDIFNSMHRI